MTKRFTMGNRPKRPYRINQMAEPAQLSATMKEHGMDIPVSEDLSPLYQPRKVGKKNIPNSIATQPCEGFDATREGNPTELSFRRYRRFAEGGAGMLWFESFGISEDSIDSPFQLMMQRNNLQGVSELVRQTNLAAVNKYGAERKPFNIAQLNHSGRRCVDRNGEPAPICGWSQPIYAGMTIGNAPIASDEYIEKTVECYVDAAETALLAGFDGVDMKACHGYLLNDLMSGFQRPGKYGGCFENRIRAVLEIVDGIHKRCGEDLEVCIRMNAYDAIAYPFGWGMVQKEGVMEPDLTEPARLLQILCDRGVKIVNITTNSPRFAPYGEGLHAQFNDGCADQYYGTACLLQATKNLKEITPELLFVGTGLSIFEKFSGHVGAGCIAQGWLDIAAYGRQALAYPEFAVDLLEKGRLDCGKLCVLCDKCHELSMIGQTKVGCVMRDQERYLPLYRKHVMGLKDDTDNC